MKIVCPKCYFAYHQRSMLSRCPKCGYQKSVEENRQTAMLYLLVLAGAGLVALLFAILNAK